MNIYICESVVDVEFCLCFPLQHTESLVQSLFYFQNLGGPTTLRMHRALMAQTFLQWNFEKAFECCFTNKKSSKFWEETQIESVKKK